MCHIGVWDHGSTGTKMEQFVKEFNLGPKERKALEKQTVMWEPHWTCTKCWRQLRKSERKKK